MHLCAGKSVIFLIQVPHRRPFIKSKCYLMDTVLKAPSDKPSAWLKKCNRFFNRDVLQ